MINFYKIVLSLLILWVLATSCTKEQAGSEPMVKIFEPESQAIFLTPDTIDISFSIQHELPIEYIRVSIDNNNMIAVSNQQFIYPEVNTFDAKLSLHIDNIPTILAISPYYLHIAVSDYNEVSHTYQEIEIYNRLPDYKGYFVIGNNGIDASRITYYNNVFQKEFDFEISGNYTDSDISTNSNLLYIATSIPDKIRAYDATNGELRWTKEPQLPYPEFNKIIVHKNMVYASTEIGRIIGLSTNEGNQIFGTPVLPDSIPVNICATDDYIISNFRLRNAGTEFWASFYVQSGINYQQFITGFETINFYETENKNEIIAFCNKDLSGLAIVFNIFTNIIENKIEVNNLKINSTCKIDNNYYLLASSNEIYLTDIRNHSISQKYVGDEAIIDIKFNNINNQIYVAYPHKVEIISYPQFSNINTTQMTYTIESIELQYGY